MRLHLVMDLPDDIGRKLQAFSFQMRHTTMAETVRGCVERVVPSIHVWPPPWVPAQREAHWEEGEWVEDMPYGPTRFQAGLRSSSAIELANVAAWLNGPEAELPIELVSY